MAITLSRANLTTILGSAPTEASFAAVAYEHVKAHRHEVWLGMLVDFRRSVIRFTEIEDVPTPARLLELTDRQAQFNRRNRYAFRW